MFDIGIMAAVMIEDIGHQRRAQQVQRAAAERQWQEAQSAYEFEMAVHVAREKAEREPIKWGEFEDAEVSAVQSPNAMLPAPLNHS